MTQQIEPRSTALNRFMMVPIILALMLAASIGALMFLMAQERVADGERISLHLTGTCLAEAKDTILFRAGEVGVGDPVFSNEDQMLSLTLPDIPNSREHIPRLLLRQGLWQLKAGDEILLSNQDIETVELSLDDGGMPETLLKFKSAAKVDAQTWLDDHPDDISKIWLDGDMVIERPNRIAITDDFRLVSNETDPRIRMQESADFVILLSRMPITCPILWEILEK